MDARRGFRKDRGFSYVGICQEALHLLAFVLGIRIGVGAQFLRSSKSKLLRGGTPRKNRLVVSTAKQPSKGHSAIRVQEDMLPTHEIKCGRIDAHSHSRALAVEALSQKATRAVEPRFSLRGPVITPLKSRSCFDTSSASPFRLRRRIALTTAGVMRRWRRKGRTLLPSPSGADGLLGEYLLGKGRLRLIGDVMNHQVPHQDQQLSGNRDSGRFFTGRAADLQPLLLDLVVAANGGPGGLLQDPTQVAGSGLTDMAMPFFSAGGEQPGGQASVAADGLAIGKTRKVSDLGQHGGRGDQGHTGNAGEQCGRVGEALLAKQAIDLPLADSHLFLDQQQLTDVLPKHADVPLGQLVAIGGEVTSQASRRKPLGSGTVVGVHQAFDAVQETRMGTREAVALSGPVAEDLDFRREARKPREVGRRPAVRQRWRRLRGRSSNGGRPRPGLRGVAEHELLDDRFEQRPQPAVETHGFDGHGMRPGKRAKELGDLVAVLAGDLAKDDFARAAHEHADGHRVLVQVDADTGMTARGNQHQRFCLSNHLERLHVGMKGTCNTPRRKDTSRRRSLHGFTLVELLVVIAIIGVLIAHVVAGRSSRPRGGPTNAMRQQPEAMGISGRFAP